MHHSTAQPKPAVAPTRLVTFSRTARTAIVTASRAGKQQAVLLSWPAGAAYLPSEYYRPGEFDVVVGHIARCPVYVDVRRLALFRNQRLVVDAAPRPRLARTLRCGPAPSRPHLDPRANSPPAALTRAMWSPNASRTMWSTTLPQTSPACIRHRWSKLPWTVRSASCAAQSVPRRCPRWPRGSCAIASRSMQTGHDERPRPRKTRHISHRRETSFLIRSTRGTGSAQLRLPDLRNGTGDADGRRA